MNLNIFSGHYFEAIVGAVLGHYLEAIMAATVGMACIILGRVLAGKSLRKIKVSAYFFGFVMLWYLFLVGIATGIFNTFDFSIDVFRLRSVNLIPFARLAMEQGLMNVVLFLPLGVLVPLVFSGLKKGGWGKVLLASFGVSLMIEVLQIFHEIRAFDINDLIFNTLGGLAGYGIYVLLRSLFNR